MKTSLNITEEQILKLKSVYPEDSEFFKVSVSLLQKKNTGIHKSLEKQLRTWLSSESKYEYPFSTNQMLFLIL